MMIHGSKEKMKQGSRNTMGKRIAKSNAMKDSRHSEAGIWLRGRHGLDRSDYAQRVAWW